MAGHPMMLPVTKTFTAGHGCGKCVWRTSSSARFKIFQTERNVVIGEALIDPIADRCDEREVIVQIEIRTVQWSTNRWNVKVDGGAGT